MSIKGRVRDGFVDADVRMLGWTDAKNTWYIQRFKANSARHGRHEDHLLKLDLSYRTPRREANIVTVRSLRAYRVETTRMLRTSVDCRRRTPRLPANSVGH